jgi:serine/threonine-protein kinase
LDLKPANILVTREGAVKVIDFGISRRPGVAPLPKTPGAASPVYASPQQVRGEEPQFTFDTYALGAVLYELLCGHPPFDPAKGSACVKELVLNEMPMAPSRAALQPRGTVSDGQVEKIPPFRAAMMRGGLTHNELHQALKGNLDAICLYGLRKEADRRYQDVGKLRADLHSVLNGGRPQIARSGERFYRALEALQRVPVAFIGVMLALSALWAHFALKRSYEAGRTNAIQERALTDRVANNSLRQLRDELRPSLQSHPATRHAISVVDAVIEAARAGLPAFNEGPDIQQWDRLRAKPLRSPNENFKEQQ